MSPAWFVPGRIEVLGKHTDYAGGNVLVAAVDRGVTVTARPGADGIAASSAHGDPVRLTPARDPGLPPGHWGRYVQTVVDRLGANFGELAPAELRVTSTLPLASGMSSSSALVVGVALALADLNGLPDTPRWRTNLPGRIELAAYLACVENGSAFRDLAGRPGVGTHGGSEDHCAMLCGEPGRLARFRFSPLAQVGSVPFPEGWSFVVATSGVRAEKTGAARELYNAAARAVADLLALANGAFGTAHATLAEAVTAEGADAVRGLVAGDARLSRRLDHFLAESERLVPAAASALECGDLGGFAAAAAESQSLAEGLLGNQVPETVALARLALERGAVAASSFGAGFGGSVWALVPGPDADAFAADWVAAYRVRCPGVGVDAETIVTRPSDGARRLA